jgi:RNA polymerase-interacting CarD/CdnL/TRCF family regulator
MEQLRIQLVNGRWTVNGRIYSEMSFLERELLDKAITGLSKEIEYYKSIEDFNYNKRLSSLEVNGYEMITINK